VAQVARVTEFLPSIHAELKCLSPTNLYCTPLQWPARPSGAGSAGRGHYLMPAKSRTPPDLVTQNFKEEFNGK
jgi:hypothetical protein